ncbi:hypothetical protein ABZ618_25370 [Streptomyces roseolus]|uniref:hypothetical protein n=1 Tax=Streptomyces roseolus TaxID=67358 RepID=UPI0033F1D981
MRPGSTWRNTSRFRGRTGELVYRLEAREPAHPVFVGANKTVTATDDLLFEAVSPRGTALTCQASLRFKGLAKLATPFPEGELERLPATAVERRSWHLAPTPRAP